jgi:CubicO group peptidase (beta-lactamase class C family)
MLKTFIKYIPTTIVASVFSLYVTAAQNTPYKTYFDDERIAKINDYVVKGMRDENIPGAAIALIESGEIVYIKGFGVADTESTEVTAQTPFQIASMTKPFSATLVLLLEQDGKLSLDDLVIDHLPWFKTSDKALSDRITIRHLLQHNSGFTRESGNYSQNSTYRGANATGLSVQRLSSAQLSAEPGTHWEYSNSNYHVIGHLVEVIEGASFEQVMADRILQPLGMQNSYVQVATHKTVKEANGFPQWFGLPIERPFTHGRMKVADSGIVSSAEDLAKYLLEVSLGQSGVISSDIRSALLDPKHNNNTAYALGWNVSERSDQVIFEHDGMNGGFSSSFGFSDATISRDTIAFVILTNYSSAINNQFLMNARRVILGDDPLPAQKNVGFLINLAMLYLTILALVFFLYRAVKNKYRKKVSVKSFIVPLLLITYSYVMAYTAPAISKINLLSIYPFFPDLAVGMFLCAGLSLLLALVMLSKRLRSLG